MDLFQSVAAGFEVALAPANLVYVFVGVLIGTTIGVLPGLGPSATIALLLPVTYSLPPEAAIILLAGVYYGAMYGGTITSILLRLPGEAASVVTVIDGYQMARQGRAGPALGIAAIGSFIGGTVAVAGITFLAPTLANFAVRFGPPEYTALVVLGILLVTYLGSKSVAKSLVMAAFGLLLATIGQDPVSGSARFTFGTTNLLAGLDIVPVAMGLFGVGEILYNLEQQARTNFATSRIRNVWPSWQDWSQAKGSIFRGSIIGFFLGVLPGGSGVLGSMASYALEKRRSKEPERFGHGAIEGVAGPETANNAAVTASFIPLLTLGIPSNAVIALVFGALLLQGITPGPLLISQNPNIFWGVIASMYIGNVFLLLLNIPLVRVFVQLLRVRAAILAPLTVLVAMVGVFSLNNDAFDMWLVLVFGVLGYLMNKSGFEPGPLVLAFILGPILEVSFRQSLRISSGDLGIFVTRPISATIIAAVLLLTTVSIFRLVRNRSR